MAKSTVAMPPTKEAVTPSVRQIINVYCDESCHLENDRQKAMAIGGLWCPKADVQRITKQIRLIKRAHDINPYQEMKWTKVSQSKSAFFHELLEMFFDDESLHFRCVLIPDKSALRHADFDQTHDDFYYKMYYFMLRHVVSPQRSHHIYLDIKDTRGGKKTAKLREVLANNFYDTNGVVISRIQQMRSSESELLQLADILIGAVSYAGRGLSSGSGKGRVLEHIAKRRGGVKLNKTTPYGDVKFSILVWEGR